MQEKENQKVVFISLSPFTKILNMKNIPKKKKNPDQPTQDHRLNDSDCPISKQE